MDMKTRVENRVKWIKDILESTGARGIIYGNSGGKDCTLVGALCRMATENVLGVIMPCQSSANYGSDRDDAIAAGERFGIEQTEVDLTAVKEALVAAMGDKLAPADTPAGAERTIIRWGASIVTSRKIPRSRIPSTFRNLNASGRTMSGERSTITCMFCYVREPMSPPSLRSGIVSISHPKFSGAKNRRSA